MTTIDTKRPRSFADEIQYNRDRIESLTAENIQLRAKATPPPAPVTPAKPTGAALVATLNQLRGAEKMRFYQAHKAEVDAAYLRR